MQGGLRQRQQLEQGGAGFELAFQYPVEHVFEGPGIFTGDHGAGEATAALEGVVRATQGFQGLVVFGIGAPGVQAVGHGAQHLVRLFEEDFEDLFVDVRLDVRGEFVFFERGRRCLIGGRFGLRFQLRFGFRAQGGLFVRRGFRARLRFAGGWLLFDGCRRFVEADIELGVEIEDGGTRPAVSIGLSRRGTVGPR